MNANDIIAIARRTKSLMHREEMAYLCELAQLAPDGDGLEIGVYMGASLIAWGLTRHGRGRAMGVDDWSYRDIPELRAKCQSAIDLAMVDCALYDMTSAEADEHIPGPLSFLFVDGNHTRLFVEQDITLWTPKLCAGGIVAFHDYGRRKNDCAVTEVVDGWQKREGAHWKRLGLTVTTIAFLKL